MAREVLTNSEMVALINAGQKVTYKGRILRNVADVPTDQQILLDYPEYGYTRIEGNAKAILGYQITGDIDEGVVPKFDNTLKKWVLATVAGGAGGNTLVIKESDGTPTLTASTLELDQGDGFVLSNPSGSIAKLKLANIPWSVVSKSASSLADLTTRSASDLSSGTLSDSRLSSNVTLAGNSIATDKLLGRDSSGTGAFEAIGLAGSLVFTGTQNIQLSGDSASPGNSKYYGTNNLGTKGFFDLPAGGSGDVVGPASSTDNAIVRFDTTTGKLIQNSLSTIDDSGSLHAASTIFASSTGGIQFGDSGGIAGANRGFISTSSDGTFRFGDSAGGGSPHIILGSIGASTGVRIKRSSTTLAIRNGDDSADASISASAGTFSGIVTVNSDNLRATLPRFTTGISDANGNSILAFSPTSSAVNYLSLANSATGTPPNNYVTIASLGADASVPIRFIPKGSAYPDGGKIYFPVNTRYDDLGISFWDNSGPITGVGIGMKSGGSTFEITAPNISLGSGREVMMLGHTILSWGTTNTGPITVGQSTGTPSDEPPGRSTGIEKGSDGVLRFVGFSGNISTSYRGGTWGARANTPSTIAADQNNYDPGGNSYFQRWSSDATRTVTGMVFSVSSQCDGQVHRIWNVGSNDIIFAHQSTSTATAANRFVCSTGSNITLSSGQWLEVQYDGVLNRWRVGLPYGAGGSGITALTGDVTASGSGSVAATIANDAVTYAKIQNVSAASKLLGRGDSGSGDVQEITLGSGLTMTGTTLSASGGGGGSVNPTSGILPYNNSGTFADTNLSFSSNVLTSTRDSLGNTPTDSLVLINNTNAANGAQQNSPALRWSGKGWKSNTTATSQTAEWRADLRPLQGEANTNNRLVFSSQVAGGGFTERIVFGVAETGTAYVNFPGGAEGVSVNDWPGVTLGPNFGDNKNPIINGFYAVPGGSYLIVRPANRFGTHGSGFSMLSGATLSWNSNALSITTGQDDTFINKRATANIALGNKDADGVTTGRISPVAQTLSVQNAISQTNAAPASQFSIVGPLGTGNTTPGRVHIQAGAASVTSGTTGHSIIDRHIFGSTKALTNNTNTSLVSATVASNTVAAGVIRYAVEVTDGTDVQVEVGTVHYKVTNKGGVIANNSADKSGNQQSATSGTLTVTFSMTAANPAQLQVNVNSSLTSSTGFPRITFSVENLTNQAVSIV